MMNELWFNDAKVSVREDGLGGGVREFKVDVYEYVPGLPKATHVAGYVAGNAEVWGFGVVLVGWIGKLHVAMD